MNKICLKLLLTTFIIGFLIKVALAASLTLTNIGALATNNSKYSEWWYTGINPTFKGTTTAGSEVKIKLNSTENKVTADSAGNWSYSATLASGDHTVAITSGSESYSFTLHLGQDMSASDAGVSSPSARQTTTSVPSTGYNQMVGVTTALVLIGAGMYSYVNGMRNQKKIHVKYILKSLDKDNSF
ncbi:hypothetical protein A2V49_03985 [candidate division WWE3 bacterium RBG_19FT_COMBO_34_6]|uniref:Bacterial Ig-like domain-containing protein n=1 Tax=candidate division WWE3 bacterium RBG_19FT_COMBO_34_6 TaxID=1802612 RepID=A0A1F4UM39_UNCKA|nr:MAG: hypothetical protein A2V49_03985 [candidate division WWE3 bacterium RBG_19FT_COMBO_34_6]